MIPETKFAEITRSLVVLILKPAQSRTALFDPELKKIALEGQIMSESSVVIVSAPSMVPQAGVVPTIKSCVNSMLANPSGRAPISVAMPVTGSSVTSLRRKVSLTSVFRIANSIPLSGLVVREIVPFTVKPGKVIKAVPVVEASNGSI